MLLCPDCLDRAVVGAMEYAIVDQVLGPPARASGVTRPLEEEPATTEAARSPAPSGEQAPAAQAPAAIILGTADEGPTQQWCECCRQWTEGPCARCRDKAEAPALLDAKWRHPCECPDCLNARRLDADGACHCDFCERIAEAAASAEDTLEAARRFIKAGGR